MNFSQLSENEKKMMEKIRESEKEFKQENRFAYHSKLEEFYRMLEDYNGKHKSYFQNKFDDLKERYRY